MDVTAKRAGRATYGLQGGGLRKQSKHRTFCSRATLRVCSNLMGPKFVVALLVVALSGVNSGLASICAAYCMSSPSAASAVHSHQTKPQAGSTSTSQNIHGHHNGAECAECPPNSGGSLKQKADCVRLDQMQMLKEGSFNLDAPRGLALLDAADMLVHSVGLPGKGERSFAFASSRSIRSIPSSSLPLRI
jgi:hypothetical protein